MVDVIFLLHLLHSLCSRPASCFWYHRMHCYQVPGTHFQQILASLNALLPGTRYQVPGRNPFPTDLGIFRCIVARCMVPGSTWYHISNSSCLVSSNASLPGTRYRNPFPIANRSWYPQMHRYQVPARQEPISNRSWYRPQTISNRS